MIGSLIQLSGWPGRGSAQARTTSTKAVSALTANRPERTVRARRVGQVEAVERQHRAQPGIEPIELGIVAALAHGEDADAVGLQEDVGRDLQHRRDYFLRPTSFSSQWMS